MYGLLRTHGAAFEKNALVCLFILSFTQLLTLVIVTVPPSSAVAPPQFDGFVVLERGGGNDVLGGVAGRAQDDVRVAEQLLHDLLRLQVPYVHLGFNWSDYLRELPDMMSGGGVKEKWT